MLYTAEIGNRVFRILRPIHIYLYLPDGQAISMVTLMVGTIPMFFHTQEKVKLVTWNSLKEIWHLRDHQKNGKRVFLFEQAAIGYVKFISEVEVIEVDFFETHDRQGNSRIGIKFFFKRAGVFIPYQPSLFDEPELHLAEPDQFPIYNTEKHRFVNTRVGQGAYRKRIVHRWEYKCAVTKFDNLKILVASHIVPWAEADNEQRLDVNNGILLSPTYDALFDRNLISFENSGKIILSDIIERQAFEKIGVTGQEMIYNFSQHNQFYLEQHRQRLT